jgi:2'-5' RNA ligase
MSPKPEYMLWLVPEGDDLDRLQALVRSLAKRLGTPTLVPHVTIGLISGLSLSEIRRRTRELASRSGPLLEVRLERFSESGLFFKCVVLDAERSEGLLGFHKRFTEAFSGHVAVGLNRDSASEFRPHLSLVYGDLDAARRRDIIRGLPASELVRTLRFESVAIVEVDGTPSGSRVVERVRLGMIN